MSDFQAKVAQLVDQFVQQITGVAQDAATNMLSAAVKAANDAVRRVRGDVAIAATPAAPLSVPKPRAKGEKRRQSEIESTRQRLLDFIAANPGLRVEEINRKLGTRTREAALPLRKLIAEGAIRSEGEKRSTQYFPAGNRAARPTEAAAPTLRRRP